MHAIILLAGLISHVPSTPNVPTLAHPPVMVYGNPGKSRIGKHSGYGYRLNQSPDGVEVAPVVKGKL